jgi:hypothetical protein
MSSSSQTIIVSRGFNVPIKTNEQSLYSARFSL